MTRARTTTARERDLARTVGVHPYLAAHVLQILDALDVLGFPMFITGGLRSDAEQAALYAQGRSEPGPIVTHADGVTHRSLHQAQTDGFGHAIDCAFVDDPATVRVETWDDRQPWTLYGTMGEAFGLTWGGRWHSIADRPHLELAMGSPFTPIPVLGG